nr:DEAD/DEAH box helicase [Clostridium frigoris]
MRRQGNKAFNNGLVTKTKGKKINNMYNIYGKVKNDTKSKELNTHIKIDLSKKKLDRVKCTCDDFKDVSILGHSFMCSHLAATAYSFLRLAVKDNSEKSYKEKKVEKLGSNDTGKKDLGSIIKLNRKVTKESIYYEAQQQIGMEKIKIETAYLKVFFEGLNDKKVRLNYDGFEFEALIVKQDLPLAFTLKMRQKYFVLTTHKQFPISLNDKNDVYLFNWRLYLPSKDQVQRYIVICEKLRENGEILYGGGIDNYNKITSFLGTISSNINIGEEVKTFASNFIKIEFYLYEVEHDIYCDLLVVYGNEKINILRNDRSKDSMSHNYKTSTRDYKFEEKIIMELEKYRFVKRDERLLFIGSDEQLFDILNKSKNNLYSLGNVTLGNGLKHMEIHNAKNIKAELKEMEGYYEFSYSIDDIYDNELKDVLNSFKQNDRFYKTKKNNFLNFEDETVKSFFDLILVLSADELLENGSIRIEKNKALYLENKIKDKKFDFIKGCELLKDIEDIYDNINKMDIRVPINLKAKLRKYQIDGFKWLKSLSALGLGGILADEMGLGKTVQTIAFLLSEENKKSIIISPTSLIYNWKAELGKFAPSLKVAIVHGEKKGRYELIHNVADYDIILTTYGTLKMDLNKYDNIVFDFCFIDEAQNIKNHLAQNAKVIKKVKAKVRYAITGTPIENNLTELWSIFDFVMPNYLYSKEIFESKFISGKKVDLGELKLLIKPFLLRRTKNEVLRELPDKIEKKFLVEMTTSQKAVYKSYIKAVRDKMKNNTDGKMEVFSYLTSLRQICLDPSLVIEGYKGGSGKIKIATELIQKHVDDGGKILLFSQFTSALKNIGENLKEKGISYFYLDGKTKSKDRIKLVDEFNKSCQTFVFLISLKAGGTGLNLTSANLVIHFDPWWNPAVENQATDRAHRIGQKNVVEVIKLVAKGTIEEKIILLQENKKNIIDSVITGEFTNSDALAKLTKEELLEILMI